MSSVVVFSKDSGKNRVKAVKRFRGGEKAKLGPEVKKYNCFESGADSQALYTSHDFVNNYYGGTIATTTCYLPLRLNWPTIGATDHQRVGSRINLRAMRFKGWVTLTPNQVKPIRWRMVLCRLDIPQGGTITFNQQNYLRQFQASDTVVPTGAFDQSRVASFCRHNFYKKFKTVENKDFKSKVIASGVLPATFSVKNIKLSLSGNVGSQNHTLTTISEFPSYIVTAHDGNVGYLPFDVTVKINDNVDCDKDLRRYYLVFETDIGYGWDDVGAVESTGPGMLVNCYSRVFFTDE